MISRKKIRTDVFLSREAEKYADRQAGRDLQKCNFLSIGIKTENGIDQRGSIYMRSGG
jgi:hypothetical protein